MEDKNKSAFRSQNKNDVFLVSKKIVFVFLILMIFLGVGIAGIIYGKSININITHVEKIFVDVNGDGKLDLILSGDVILNTDEKQNLAISQSNNN